MESRLVFTIVCLCISYAYRRNYCHNIFLSSIHVVLISDLLISTNRVLSGLIGLISMIKLTRKFCISSRDIGSIFSRTAQDIICFMSVLFMGLIFDLTNSSSPDFYSRLLVLIFDVIIHQCPTFSQIALDLSHQCQLHKFDLLRGSQ